MRTHSNTPAPPSRRGPGQPEEAAERAIDSAILDFSLGGETAIRPDSG